MVLRSRLAAGAFAGSLILSLAVLTHAAPAKSHPDLSGEWRLDPSRSDHPDWGKGRPAGERGGMPRRPEGPPGDAKGDRPHGGPRLPSYLRIEQSPDLVRLIDSTGTTVGEISTDNSPSPTSGTDASWEPGKWRGDRLEVERETPRGKVTETFALAPGGQTLEITIQRAGGAMGPGKFKRVYQRLGS